jgi:hypothetical protein
MEEILRTLGYLEANKISFYEGKSIKKEVDLSVAIDIVKIEALNNIALQTKTVAEMLNLILIKLNENN